MSSLMQTLKMFSFISHDKNSPLPPLEHTYTLPFHHRSFSFFPFAVKDDRTVQSRPRLLTAYQINTKIPSPSTLPSPSSNFTVSRWQLPKRGGGEGDDGGKTRSELCTEGLGPKRNHINSRPQLSYRQPWPHDASPEEITTKKTERGGGGCPEASSCSSPYAAPSQNRHHNINRDKMCVYGEAGGSGCRP